MTCGLTLCGEAGTCLLHKRSRGSGASLRCLTYSKRDNGVRLSRLGDGRFFVSRLALWHVARETCEKDAIRSSKFWVRSSENLDLRT